MSIRRPHLLVWVVLVAALAWLAYGALQPPRPDVLRGVGVRAVDGDTLVVRLDGGRQERVRRHRRRHARGRRSPTACAVLLTACRGVHRAHRRGAPGRADGRAGAARPLRQASGLRPGRGRARGSRGPASPPRLRPAARDPAQHRSRGSLRPAGRRRSRPAPRSVGRVSRRLGRRRWPRDRAVRTRRAQTPAGGRPATEEPPAPGWVWQRGAAKLESIRSSGRARPCAASRTGLPMCSFRKTIPR